MLPYVLRIKRHIDRIWTAKSKDWPLEFPPTHSRRRLRTNSKYQYYAMRWEKPLLILSTFFTYKLLLVFSSDIHYEDTGHRTVNALKNTSEARLVSTSIHQLRRVHLCTFILLDSGGDVQNDLWKYSGSSMSGSAPALPRATRPSSAPRLSCARSTHQHSVTPAKSLPPMPDSASGKYWEPPSRGRVVPSLARARICGEAMIYSYVRSRFLPGFAATLTLTWLHTLNTR